MCGASAPPALSPVLMCAAHLAASSLVLARWTALKRSMLPMGARNRGCRQPSGARGHLEPPTPAEGTVCRRD